MFLCKESVGCLILAGLEGPNIGNESFSSADLDNELARGPK